MDNEIKAQIDRLRKTRPTRAVEAMAGNYSGGIEQLPELRGDLVSALSLIRDDLKEEARLVEQAKMRGGTSIVKDRLAVAGWLELFVVQLGRESDAPAPSAPTERLSPSAELTEHRPSEFSTYAAILPGPGGRCAVGNVHDASTLKCACGYRLTPANEVEAFLSGASDDLLAPLPAGSSALGAISADESERQSHEVRSPGIMTGLAALAEDLRTDVEQRLGVDLAQQAAHNAVDQEMSYVTADPISDPFAPIPRQAWGGPVIPPGGQVWNAGMLLHPVDAASLPAHLSFSQATTVTDCGAKYRMQRIAQLPQVPQWANIGGKAFHSAVEDYEKGGRDEWGTYLDREIVGVEQASGMVREQFRASAQGKEGYDWWRVEGAAMLQRYVDWRQGEFLTDTLLTGPDGAPMLEWETTYGVDHVPFKTILDSVWKRADGVAIIRDWKTGSMTPDDRQLCTQAWGLRMAGWQGPILVQFFDARKGVFSSPFDPFERMSWDDVRYFVLSADATRRQPVLPARPSDFCGGCSVAYACPIVAQRRVRK